jgi:hypothetical protein
LRSGNESATSYTERPSEKDCKINRNNHSSSATLKQKQTDEQHHCIP